MGILTDDLETSLVFEALGISERPFIPFKNEIERYPNYHSHKEDLAALFKLVNNGYMTDERPNLEVTRAFSKHRFSVTEKGIDAYKALAWVLIKRYRRKYTDNKKLTARDLEHGFALHFDPRKNIIVPNISWGLLQGHEADLLILSPTGYSTEVEIKVSMSDLKADKLKDKWTRYAKREVNGNGVSTVHHSKMIHRFWYGITVDLFYLGALEHIPEHAGVIVYGDCNTRVIRHPQKNPDARKLTGEEREKLLHLGVMRTWDTRSENNRLKLQNTVLQAELDKLKATQTTRGLDGEGGVIRKGNGDNPSGEQPGEVV